MLQTEACLTCRCAGLVQVAPMAHKRGSHVCTVADQDLYVIGGWDAKDYLAGVEIFDVRSGGWRTAAPMAAPRAYGAAATVDGSVFTLGGMQSQVPAAFPKDCMVRFLFFCFSSPLASPFSFLSSVLLPFCILYSLQL